MKKNQKGFGLIEGLLILVIVGIVGGVGYFVYSSQKDTNKSLDNAASSSSSSVPKATTPKANKPSQGATTTDNSGYLVISEWGIKVKLSTADPTIVEYKLNNSVTDTPGFGTVQDLAKLSLKDSVTTDANCKSLGIYIYKQLISDSDGSATSAKKLGKYYYGVGGNPYYCGDTKLDAIRTNYVGNNPENWSYSEL